MKMEPTGCPETSARNDHCTLRIITEEQGSQVYDLLQFQPR